MVHMIESRKGPIHQRFGANKKTTPGYLMMNPNGFKRVCIKEIHTKTPFNHKAAWIDSKGGQDDHIHSSM